MCIDKLHIEFVNAGFEPGENPQSLVDDGLNTHELSTDELWIIDLPNSEFTLLNYIEYVQGDFENPYLIMRMEEHSDKMIIRMIVDFKLDVSMYDK